MSEDLRPSGDITTQLIRDNKKIKAKIISNENCVIGGLNFAKEAFKYSDRQIVFKIKIRDGKKTKKGKVIAVVSGKAKSICNASATAAHTMTLPTLTGPKQL